MSPSVGQTEELLSSNADRLGSQPIVLTTDFGLDDPYVGVMKGVVLGINPGVQIIDLTHRIRPQNLRQAAFVLGTSYHFFPPDSIHVVVIDPGVGTNRLALLLLTPQGRFLAPDNGVLSQVLRDYLDSPPEGAGRVAVPGKLAAYSLNNPSYWLHPVSQTFHGRDIFAPVAGHLSLGVPPELLGEPVTDLSWLPSPRPRARDKGVLGEVINVDHYGNLVTNIPASMLVGQDGFGLTISGQVIKGLSQTYQGNEQAAVGELVALLGSQGYLEVAVRNGSAALFLDVDIGEPVYLTVPRPG